ARGFVRVAVGVALQAGHDAGASLAARRLGIGALRTALIAATAVARIGIDVHALVRAKKGLGRTVAGALDADLRGQTGISAAAAVLDTGGSVHTRALASREPRRADAFAVDAELALEAGAI